MALPSSGALKLSDVNVELGLGSTTQRALGQATTRTLYGVASGAVRLAADGYGKSNRAVLSYTYSGNAADASLNLSGLSGYSSGKSDITVTINSGVYLYATSTSSYGLSLSGGTSGDTLTIVNNGYIMGQGGMGHGQFDPAPASFTDGIGGPAVYFGFGMSSCTINNTNGSAYIGGGGGGGAGVGGVGGGGGAGGGGGGSGNNGGCCGNNNTLGGAGGGPGSSGANGTYPSGAGGGRIFPGASAYQGGYTSKGGEAGGQGGHASSGSGGTGGGSNSAGSNGSYGGGGGGWGASGGQANNANATYKPGSVGGKAINLNGKSVTWTSGDTTRVYGSVA